MINFTFKKTKDLTSDVAVFLISDSGKLPSLLASLDINKQIANSIKADCTFAGKSGHIISILAPYNFKQIILLCLGSPSEATDLTIQNAAGALLSKLNEKKIREIDLCIETHDEFNHDLATNLAIGIKLKNYSFSKHYVAKKDEHILSMSNVNILADGPSTQFLKHQHIIDGTLFTRDLVSESPNNLYPISFAEECKKLESLGLKIRILDIKELQDLKMNALLGVAQGSAHEPRVAIMEWLGDPKNPENVTALIGKGVTFDSGGINLKPSSGISSMKYDMGGAGVVTGTMMSLASRKAKANIIGVIGLVENMPSGTAQRPSDVVVSMSGQTIEVDNTDAEGRLVLADIMWYTQEKYRPKNMIDLATLTGAITIALGDYYAGLFANNDSLAAQLIDAGSKVGEPLWRLPLDDFYDKQINSEIADIKNTGQSGRGAGSITAAQFLKRFVQDCTWAHLDIAGVTWTKYGNNICPKGATGFGVRLLNQYIADHLENNA